MNLGFAASSVFGAALAGGLIAAFGLSVALLVDAASFAAIAIVLLVARDLPEVGARGPHAVARALRRRARVRARLPARAHAADRPGARADLLHDRRADRGHLRQGEPRDHRRGLRHPRLLVGRGHRGRQPALPVAQEPHRAADDPALQRRGRRRLPRDVPGGHAGGGVRVLGARRRRQRRPVGRGDDAAAGGDPGGVPGAHVRAARVAGRRRARRRLPRRGRDRRTRLPAHRLRMSRARESSCWWSWPRSCGRTVVRPRRRPARPSGGA